MRIYTLLLALFFFGCSSKQLYYSKQQKNWQNESPSTNNPIEYTLYLVGDAGADTAKSSLVLNNLRTNLIAGNQDKSGVVFLGDNIYPKGLHKKNSEYRQEDELRLNAQLDAVKDFKGKTVFIPGNHDWKGGKAKGLKYVKRQEKYIEKYLENKEVFYPNNGCPGPTEIQLAPGLLLIVIDTQWWLHQYEKSRGEKDGCVVRSTEELTEAFKDMLKKYRSQNIIVAGHHPLYSNGNHGGDFQFKDHLFPLTAKAKNAYVPMPIVGSIYPLYRKYIGFKQDVANPLYTEMIRDLEHVMNGYDNIVYVAGHEHNLQYTHRKSIHHIVSGSGSKVTYLKYNKAIDFGGRTKGYSKLNYHQNGELWLEFVVFNPETNQEETAFRKHLFTKKAVGKSFPKPGKTSYKGQYVNVYPDSVKGAGKLKAVFFGNLNRDLWTTPIKVPYLDINYEKGGLTPIKKGGGMQTLSLRMLGSDGKQYTLRGIKKSPEFIVPKDLRGTVAQDVVYDGFAGSHPYAAVVIPYLAKEVDVYYSDAKLVYVPKDSVLGDYLDEFGGMFCLLEQRPDDDVSDQANFGNSEKVGNFVKTLEKIHSKHHHKIDKDFAVRTRTFDMLIGDFDRHDDQWRWAKIKTDSNTLYRPIPRDRDQAFFRADGLALNITKWRWLLWYTQDFFDGAEDVLGLNSQARHFDRSFLTEADLNDWVAQAKYIQENLSDAEIEAAVRHFPPEIFEIRGEDIIKSLKIRRDELVDYVTEYYQTLAREVDVVGSYKDDFIRVKRLKNGDVEVSIYPRKDGKPVKDKRSYHRVFDRKVTKEIRIYGLDGNDEYKITGEVKKSILVRIVAGEGKDKIADESRVKGLRKHTQFFDIKGKAKIEEGKDTKVTLMKAEDMYDYDRLAFKYNKTKPAISVGFNPNDGLIIGPGIDQTIHGFKKEPYKFHHKLLANYMTRINGFNVYYNFDWIDAFGKADLMGKITINNPLSYDYYGDESDTNNNIAFRVLMNSYKAEPALVFSSANRANRLIVGVHYNHVNFESNSVPNTEYWELNTQNYWGAKLEYQFLNKDHKINPHSGMEFKMKGEYINSMDNSNVDYLNLSASLSLFVPLKFIPKQSTLAFRFGGATNIGDYAFYQSNFLNGYENFRGVRRNRYAGRSSSFNNVEYRMNLFKVPNYIIPFDVGLMAHFDFASISNIELTHWHSSAGGGLFLSTMESFMLFGTYSVSSADQLLVVGGSFLF